jgi:magnesium transporter
MSSDSAIFNLLSICRKSVLGDGVSGRHSVLVIFGEGCPSLRPSTAVISGCVTEMLYGLRGASRERVAALREAGRFFWLDVSLSETNLDEVIEAMDLPERTARALAGHGETGGPSRRFHADGHHLVFRTSCYVEPSDGQAGTLHMRPVDVRVLVAGEYLLTLHEERVALTKLIATDIAEGRGEQYVIYSVLDAMLDTSFAALNQLEQTLDDLVVAATDVRAGRVRTGTLQEMISGLAGMRRRAGPQRGLFERLGVEIERLPGLEPDEERYFDRLAKESNQLLDAIDAAADGMATVIDLRLNETSYLLTAVATIFLPLTFLVGFFGMNFEWMIGQIDTQLAFWLLGVGASMAAALVAWRTVARRSPIRVEDDSRFE